MVEDGGEVFLRRAFGDQEGGRMSRQVRLNVSLTIHDGKLDEFQRLAQEAVAVARKEPGTLAYEWYLSADGKQCRLVEVYADAEATLAHFLGPAVQEIVPKIAQHASISGFDIYGDPGPKVTEMVAGFRAEIFGFRYGLER